jgi:hypothetical protein
MDDFELIEQTAKDLAEIMQALKEIREALNVSREEQKDNLALTKRSTCGTIIAE